MIYSRASVSGTVPRQGELAGHDERSVNPSGAHRSGKRRGTAAARGISEHASGLQSVPREHLDCSEVLTRTVRGRRASARVRDSKRQPIAIRGRRLANGRSVRPSQFNGTLHDRGSTRSIVRKRIGGKSSARDEENLAMVAIRKLPWFLLGILADKTLCCPNLHSTSE